MSGLLLVLYPFACATVAPFDPDKSVVEKLNRPADGVPVALMLVSDSRASVIVPVRVHVSVPAELPLLFRQVPLAVWHLLLYVSDSVKPWQSVPWY